ncbi:MAG: ComF family protein [Gammaproteobacteria bacterium]|nr:ComF family protein [Gammaproteobacteria bacterium]
MPKEKLAERLYRVTCGLAASLDDMLMPDRCAFCGTRTVGSEKSICSGCRHDLPWIEHACDLCGQSLAAPLPPAVACAACQQEPAGLVATLAPLRYEFPVDAGLKALKFQRRLFYGAAFGELLVEAAGRLPADIDALLPVPLHWRRKTFRGFNQAAELCRPLLAKLSLPLLRGVLRRRPTAYQTGLTSRQRDSNLREAFVVKRTVTARHVLIVDDVITTGATTRHLARALRESGVNKVSALAVARAAGQAAAAG